jgi:hypothetical protein
MTIKKIFVNEDMKLMIENFKISEVMKGDLYLKIETGANVDYDKLVVFDNGITQIVELETNGLVEVPTLTKGTWNIWIEFIKNGNVNGSTNSVSIDVVDFIDTSQATVGVSIDSAIQRLIDTKNNSVNAIQIISDDILRTIIEDGNKVLDDIATDKNTALSEINTLINSGNFTLDNTISNGISSIKSATTLEVAKVTAEFNRVKGELQNMQQQYISNLATLETQMKDRISSHSATLETSAQSQLEIEIEKGKTAILEQLNQILTGSALC